MTRPSGVGDGHDRHTPEATRTFRIDHTGRVTATVDRADDSRLDRVDTVNWVEVR